jgi:hypothetical protein
MEDIWRVAVNTLMAADEKMSSSKETGWGNKDTSLQKEV